MQRPEARRPAGVFSQMQCRFVVFQCAQTRFGPIFQAFEEGFSECVGADRVLAQRAGAKVGAALDHSDTL